MEDLIGPLRKQVPVPDSLMHQCIFNIFNPWVGRSIAKVSGAVARRRTWSHLSCFHRLRRRGVRFIEKLLQAMSVRVEVSTILSTGRTIYWEQCLLMSVSEYETKILSRMISRRTFIQDLGRCVVVCPRDCALAVIRFVLVIAALSF